MSRRRVVVLATIAGALGTLGVRHAEARPCEPTGLIDATLARAIPRVVSGRLENGLRYHLVPRPGDPGVSVRVAYDVGSRDEAPGLGGTAHLFEHMMFKGGGRVPDGGHFRAVRDVGGYTNATTDFDLTQYWQNVPRQALERVLFLEAERMQTLRLTRANLDNQRAAIREEGLGLENLPYVDAAIAFGSQLFADTPYAHTPLGTPEELEAMGPEEAEAFHDTWYTPSNAVIVIVGGFDDTRALRFLEQSFGRVPFGRTPPVRGGFTLDPTPRHVEADDPLAPFPIVATLWHGVSADDPDAAAAAVLDALLLGHPEARLDRAFAADESLQAFSVHVAMRDLGLLGFAFVPRTFVSTESLRERVAFETERLTSEGPTDAETCLAIRRELRDRLEALSTAEGVGVALARAALLQGDARAFERELRAIEAIETDDVTRVAGRIFSTPMHSLEVRPVGAMRFVKRLLEWLPDGVGDALERMLL